MKLSSQLRYNFTFATTADTSINIPGVIGKQLRYVPKQTGSLSLTAAFKHFDFTINDVYRGGYYLTDDESGLPVEPVNITNLYVGTWIDFKNVRWNINFQIKNLLDAQYQLVQSYPMPGRAFYLNFTILFNKNN